SALEFVTESMRPLHTGDFGGLPIKLVWFFFGLVLTLMVFSGLLIWTKRTAQATAAALKRSARAPRPARSATPVEIHS
ncbi:MAG: PepSY domain-containing protein, partial [Pseudomonas alloputida]